MKFEVNLGGPYREPVVLKSRQEVDALLRILNIDNKCYMIRIGDLVMSRSIIDGSSDMVAIVIGSQSYTIPITQCHIICQYVLSELAKKNTRINELDGKKEDYYEWDLVDVKEDVKVVIRTIDVSFESIHSEYKFVITFDIKTTFDHHNTMHTDTIISNIFWSHLGESGQATWDIVRNIDKFGAKLVKLYYNDEDETFVLSPNTVEFISQRFLKQYGEFKSGK